MRAFASLRLSWSTHESSPEGVEWMLCIHAN